jgi:hypothetical protein
MIQIIAHRGYWLKPSEKNTFMSFSKAFENGFGIETDLRDFDGELVISHDIPNKNAMKVFEFIDLYKKYPISVPVALNIKSDGLRDLINQFIAYAEFKNAFVFDMTVPDMRSYLQNKIPTFTRLSEYEPFPILLDSCKGVWLDAFESEWYGTDVITSLLHKQKQIAIVSPELHGRSYMALWDLIKANNFHRSNLVSICTDFPMQAKEFFYE